MNKTYQDKLLPILLNFLKDTKADLEKRGYIATLDMAIEELEDKIKYPYGFISDKDGETHEQGYQPEKN